VINELIKQCVDDLGATALSITHDMQSLRVIGDGAAMIYDGRIIWHGAARDIDHSGSPYVEQFVRGEAQGPIRMPVRPL
jgi:phospholipid/cholesterol/gamma-HCH transport system ATP-binding protein